jgi:membrane-bound ClpP family serine protease
MPVGNMPLSATFGTILMLVGVALSVIMMIERHTPGEGWLQITSFYALLGAALIVVGAAMAFAPSV